MHTTDRLNTALQGRYAIESLVGEGGMATVGIRTGNRLTIHVGGETFVYER